MKSILMQLRYCALVPLAFTALFGSGCSEKPKWRGYDPGPAASASAAASAAEAPAAQPPRDPVRPLHRRTYSIVTDGDIVHTGTTAGVVSWDFSDRNDPKRLASVVLEGSVQHVAALPEPSSLLAVSTGPTGLAFVDAAKAKQNELELVNEHPWKADERGGCHSAWRFVPATDTTGFVACGGSGVARVDIAEADKAAVDAMVSVGGYVRDVAVLDEASGVPKPAASSRKVAAAAGYRGLAVVDFGGIKPRALAEVELGGEARAVDVRDGHAFVAAGAAGLVIVDLRKPKEPEVVGRISPKTTDMARGIALSGSHALLCLGDSGLVVVDVTDPAKPKEVGRFDPKRALNRVTVSGQHLFVANDADGVAILDIGEPTEPKQIFPPTDDASGKADSGKSNNKAGDENVKTGAKPAAESDSGSKN
ncbi:MAG: LVIVD repeat-containing protein [Myxococcota bacterium]